MTQLHVPEYEHLDKVRPEWHIGRWGRRTLWLKSDLKRHVTAHNERTGAWPIDSTHSPGSILAKLSISQAPVSRDRSSSIAKVPSEEALANIRGKNRNLGFFVFKNLRPCPSSADFFAQTKQKNHQCRKHKIAHKNPFKNCGGIRIAHAALSVLWLSADASSGYLLVAELVFSSACSQVSNLIRLVPLLRRLVPHLCPQASSLC